MTDDSFIGRCQCGSLRFNLKAKPLFTHACHCLVCRRRSGTAFSLKTTVLKEDFFLISGEITTKRISPRTTVCKCKICETTIYSASTRYPTTIIVAGGTFEDPAVVVPGAHIWIKRKHPWIALPSGVPQFEEEYDNYTNLWPSEAIDRLEAADGKHVTR